MIESQGEMLDGLNQKLPVWLPQQLSISTLFANFFANISCPADFRIREYSREYRCPGRLFLKNIELFLSPLTVFDLDSHDIREYSRRYNRGVYNLLARASQNSAFALNSTSTVGFGSMQAKIFKF